jgi:predicted nucleic acid-binding protein
VIVVDSSVWIANQRGTDSAAVGKLQRLIAEDDDRILVGDSILLEVLQGARDERHASRIERAMRSYRIVPMLDVVLAVRAAENYWRLRAMGITFRKTADTIIGTFCIDGGHGLPHDDRDFGPMVEHLGLLVVR